MSKKIITTVGTSIFSNYQDKDKAVRTYPEVSKDYESITTQYKRLENLLASERNNSTYAADIHHTKECITYLWLPFAKEKACAELQTLFAIAQDEKKDIEVILLATDTVLSVVACELIKEWLRENPVIEIKQDNGNVNSIRITKCTFNDNLSATDTTIVKGLQITDPQMFADQGFNNLLIIIKSHIEKGNTALNISGGYKAIIPYVTLFAQLEEIPLKYIYENSDQLITVGNLPFSFDFSYFTDEYLAIEMINPKKEKQNLPSISDFIENLSSADEFKNLKDAFLIIEEDGKVDLSLLGAMLYNKYEESEKENGFNSYSLLGKIMEVKVYEYFQKQFPKGKIVLGQPVGKSVEDHAYDLDVFVEIDEEIWGIEVKPQNVDVLIRDDMSTKKKKETIEYKCEIGAFGSAIACFKEKKLHLLVIMYHHKEPNKFQIENFKSLNKKYNYIRWLWLKPKPNYKGNVNWSVDLSKFKEFNFQTFQWDNFSIKNHQN
ncbi:hypothetical protein C7N43_16730 [Sphingobacteriales bacterium UPWRP_1]|nr:hypothetical protein C7N43_16730 [Sphingobacteriales bacterium UPWRP_1]